MCWFCLDTLKAAAAPAAAEEWRMRIKLNSILKSATHSFFRELMWLWSSAAHSSEMQPCGDRTAGTLCCHGRDVIARISEEMSFHFNRSAEKMCKGEREKREWHVIKVMSHIGFKDSNTWYRWKAPQLTKTVISVRIELLP